MALPETTPPVLVLSRKKPHLIFLMGLGVISGLSIVLGQPLDPSIPLLVSKLWSSLLGLTGAVVLLAHLQKWDRERGMLVERGALLIQAATVSAYTWSLPQFLGWSTTTVLAIIAGLWWTLANVWEVRLIGTDLKLIADVRRLGAGSPEDAHE